jgi:hypothetical protein
VALPGCTAAAAAAAAAGAPGRVPQHRKRSSHVAIVAGHLLTDAHLRHSQRLWRRCQLRRLVADIDRQCGCVGNINIHWEARPSGSHAAGHITDLLTASGPCSHDALHAKATPNAKKRAVCHPNPTTFDIFEMTCTNSVL